MKNSRIQIPRNSMEAEIGLRLSLEFCGSVGIPSKPWDLGGNQRNWEWETIANNSLAAFWWESGSNPREKGRGEREWPQAEVGMEYSGKFLPGKGWEGSEWVEQDSGNPHSRGIPNPWIRGGNGRAGSAGNAPTLISNLSNSRIPGFHSQPGNA